MDCNNETEAIQQLRNCKNNISRYFTNFSNNCESQMRQQIVEMFDVLEDDGCSYIDAGDDGDELEEEINNDLKRLSSIVEDNFGVIVNNESIDLKSGVDREMKKIKEIIGQIQVNMNENTNLNIDLSSVLNELDFGFSDFVSWGSYLAGAFGVGYTIMGGALLGMGPLGWGALLLGGIFSIFFGDSKEDKAKKKFREKLGEAKYEFLYGDFQDKMSNLKSDVEKKKKQIISKIDDVIEQAKNIQRKTDDLMDDLNNMSNDLR